MSEANVQPTVRTIGLEEHAWIPNLRDRLMSEPPGMIDESLAAFNQHERGPRLIDLGAERLRLMDDAGIDMQVLSTTTPGTQPLPAAEARTLAREANDRLSQAVAEHPDRFAAFADSPDVRSRRCRSRTRTHRQQTGLRWGDAVPANRRELPGRRSVPSDLRGSCGARRPTVFAPGDLAPVCTRATYYDGFSTDINLLLATGGWGWHADAGVAALRLILAGTFDRHSGLQLILGHWGEMLVFFMENVEIEAARN